MTGSISSYSDGYYYPDEEHTVDERYQKAVDRIKALENQIQDHGHTETMLKQQISDLDSRLTQVLKFTESQVEVIEFVEKIAETKSKFASEARGILTKIAS